MDLYARGPSGNRSLFLDGLFFSADLEESVAGSIELPSLPATPLMATPKKRKAVASATPEEKGQPDLDEEAEMATPLPSRKAKLKEKVLKRPAAVSPQKKPAAKKVEKKMEGKKSWVLMYYKRSKVRKSDAWAVRQCGGSQLFQMVCSKDKNAEGICKQAVKKLEDGDSPRKVKEWAKAQ